MFLHFPKAPAATANLSGEVPSDASLDPHSASIQRMKQEIEQENATTLAKMTSYEINQAQEELFSQLDPKLLSLLKQRVSKKAGASQRQLAPIGGSVGSVVAPKSADFSEARPAASVVRTAPPAIKKSSAPKDPTSSASFAAMNPDLIDVTNAVQVHPKAVSENEAALEKLKLQWMDPISEQEKKTTTRPRSTLEAEAYRFDFDGNLLVYPHTKNGLVELNVRSKGANKVSSSVDTTLYHHGEEAALPGYTLPELVRLCRSHLPGQRQSSLRALEHIVRNAKNCQYAVPQYHNEPVIVTSLLLNHLDKECDLGLMLRTALDDQNLTTVICAIKAIHAFICNDFDESVRRGRPRFLPRFRFKFIHKIVYFLALFVGGAFVEGT